MNQCNRKRAHSRAFSLSPESTDCADCNIHMGRYPPFYPIVPKTPSVHCPDQGNLAPHGTFVTPNPPIPVYPGVPPAQQYRPANGRAPPVCPSQFNAALAAYARQQYQQYGNVPQAIHKTVPNFVNNNAFGPPGMSYPAAPPVMPVQHPSVPDPDYLPPNDPMGTLMAPQPVAGTVIRKGMNMNRAANPLQPPRIIDQIPPPRMGSLVRSPSQLNFQDLTLRDAPSQFPRPCTPPRAPRHNRTAVGVIPTAVLRE